MGAVQPPIPDTVDPGVLTKTIVRSPVCKFILHARVRDRDFNDVVFVGEDFIHVKQVMHNGHLKHIATKDDFASRIRAAKTFSLDPDPPESGDDFIKKAQSNGNGIKATSQAAPQLVVLTLDSDNILFLYLKDDATGTFEFVHQTCPLPTSEDTLHQTGEHLAVDPASRAVAVAANEREVVIYSAKSTDQIQHELQTNDQNWCPISSQKPLRVDGVILHLEFLNPPDKDPDHVILLLVLIDQRRTKAIWIDWYGNSALRHAQVHPAQPIDTARTVSSLLIPLRDAAFLLVTGNKFKLQKDILSGSMRSIVLDGANFEETNYPGNSPRRPVWTSWCQPRRNKSARLDRDIIYLIREDGLVLLVEITSLETMMTSNAGNMQCHLSSAFASLGDPSDPDILAVVGDMSNGSVVHIGNWPSARLIAERSRLEVMEMKESETLANWASSVDMVVSKLPQSNNKSPRTVDGVFLTSGREPYGKVTELRQGLDARLATYFEIDGLKSTLGAWVLPNILTGSILMLLSSPSSTRLLEIHPDESISELDESETTVMVLDQRTVTADFLHDGSLLQIGESSICASASVSAGFEDRSRWNAPNGSKIVAASIEPSLSLAITIQRQQEKSQLLVFKYAAQGVPEANGHADETEGLRQLCKAMTLDMEPICMATTRVRKGVIGVFATVQGDLQLFTLETAASPSIKVLGSLQIVGDKQSLCDHLVLLHPSKQVTGSDHDILAVCGLRDGSVVSVQISCARSPSFAGMHGLKFGHETVRLLRQPRETDKAYCFSGLDTCILTWNGNSPRSLNLRQLCISDRERQELAQGAIITASQTPSTEHLSGSEFIGSLADSLVTVSSSEVCFASLNQTVTTVPRQIPVTGTPTSLIYAEQQRSFVCASVCTGVRSFPANMRNAQPEERRQIWPAIDFIPADKDYSSFTFDLQPGEQVSALLEWSFQQCGKTYSFIMVGGSYIRQSGSKRGRITFLQPSNRNWEIVNVNEGRSTNFDQPVWALALYDDLTYIACTGDSIIASRFDTEERKWESICAPLKLSSRGIAVSVYSPLIYVSTAEDGLVTLRLENLPSRDEDESYDYRLTLVAHAPRINSSLSHTVASLPNNNNIALLSTSNNLLMGLTSPSPGLSGTHRTRLLFEAQLPRSILKLCQGSTRPLWRHDPPAGVLRSDIVGLSADGSMTGICLLDDSIWRKLFWLQRVLEWSKEFSPHMSENPNYTVEDDFSTGSSRKLPIGFGASNGDVIALYPDEVISKEADRQINGDLLAKLLEPDGTERLVDAIRELATTNDRVGQWVARHLAEELRAVDSVVAEVRTLLDLWI